MINEITAIYLLVITAVFFAPDIVGLFNSGISEISSSHKRERALCLFLALLTSGVYCSILSYKTFPVAEGWYSVYAKYINSGKVLYRDFDFLFTPVYAYIIAFITRIFGYDIYILRTFGLMLYLGITTVVFFIFEKISNSRVALVSSIISVLFLQAEIAQFFYDYIRVFDLFTYLATLTLLVALPGKTDESVKTTGGRFSSNIYFALSGTFASLSFLTRQNSGAFVIVYSIIVILYFSFLYNNKQLLKGLCTYIAFTLIPFAVLAVYFVATDTFWDFYDLAVVSAVGAKGGFLKVLFAWFEGFFNTAKLKWKYIALCLAGLAGSEMLYAKFKNKPGRKNALTGMAVIFSVTMLASSIAFYFYPRISNALANRRDFLPSVFYFVCILLFVFFLVRSFIFRMRDKTPFLNKEDALIFILLGMILAIGYGSGTSGGLSEGQTALAAGLFFTIFLRHSQHKWGMSVQFVALVTSLIMCTGIVGFKYSVPYSWWDLVEGDIRVATESVDVSYLKNIRVSHETKTGIEKIVHYLDDYSEEGESVFVFPHAPIFYLFADRYPKTRTLVQWFDVSKDQDVIQDIEVLKNNLPKVIVNIRVGEYAMSSHEHLFREDGRESGLRIMSKFLDQLVENGGYVKLDSFTIQNYPVDIYALNPI